MDHRRRHLLRSAIAAGIRLRQWSICLAGQLRGYRYRPATLRIRAAAWRAGRSRGGAAAGRPGLCAAAGELDLSKVSAAHRLDDLFALHPSLGFMAELWQQKQLAVVHAVATPYRERSHFDAQDVLESGARRPHARNPAG